MQSREHRGRFCRYALLFIVLACLPAGAEAQVETGRGAALDHLAGEVADRKIDPYAAVEELMARAGLGEAH